MLRHCLSLCAFLTALLLNAQQFEEVTNAQNIAPYVSTGLFGNGVSCYDVDQNGWDDISFAGAGGVQLYLNFNGNFSLYSDNLFESFSEIKQVLYLDFDNDGDEDALCSEYDGDVKLYENVASNSNDFQFEDISESAGMPSIDEAFTYGVCAGDYDRDGFLDIFVSNYAWNTGISNWLLHNNGDGTFTETGTELGVTLTEVPTFQTVFSDFNRDGWPDIYVINDRFPANELYLNDGDGTFSNFSNYSETNISIDAMSNSVADYNGDGWLDIFCTNGPIGCVLLQNDGDNHFVETTESMNASINMFSWGALWIDGDSDMDEDLYINTASALGEDQNLFLKNKFPEPFEHSTVISPAEQDQSSSYSSAKGDWNNDGTYDIVSLHATPNGVSLFQNTGIGGRTVKLNLEGTVSNHNAIGTWVDAHLGTNLVSKFTQCGENLMSQNAGSIIIGCGTNNWIDSLQITWPSGLEEIYYDLPTETTVDLVEGATVSSTIWAENEASLCGIESILLDAGEGNSFLWTNDATMQTIEVSEPGIYSVEKVNVYGFTEDLSIEVVNTTDFSIDANVVNPSCAGLANGSITISFESSESELIQHLWNGNIGNLNQLELEAGAYTLELTDQFGCSDTFLFNLTAPEAILIETSVEQPLCAGDLGVVNFTSSGGVLPHIANFPSPCSLPAGESSIQITDANDCQTTTIVEIIEPQAWEVNLTTAPAINDDLGTAELTIAGGTPPYTIVWSFGSSTAQNVTVAAGEHSVSITDDNDCLWETDFEIEWIQNVSTLAKQQGWLYPNPMRLGFYFEGKPDEQSKTIALYDAQGTLVKVFQRSSSKQWFDCEDLPNGLYFLQVQSPSFEIHRLVKIE